MSLSLRLRAERKQISEQMRGLLNSTSPNAAEQWRTLDAAQSALEVRINSIEQDAIERDLSNNLRDRDRVQDPQRPPIGNEYDGMERTLNASDQARSTPEYRKAFASLIRSGKESYETRALSSSGDGQTLIPLGFQNELEVRLKSFSGMRQACRIIRTHAGNNLTWPTVDDVGTSGAIVAESAGVTQADPTFSSVTLGSSLISSKQVIVPIQVLQDTAIDLEQYLGEAFTVRIGRAMETNYTTGSGTITGLITALVAAGGRSTLAVGANANSGNAGDNALNTVGSQDLSNLVSNLDPAYVQNASFMANATTWNKLRSQLDKYGRPIWSVSVASGEPDKVWGKPFFYNQNMASIGAGNISMLFGDFQKYIIRDSLGFTLAIQRELYITNHQVGFLAFCRTDGKLLQPSAFTMLTHPLS
jgi:HK97 family phage major capsid protein